MATSALAPLKGRRSTIAWQPYLAIVIAIAAVAWEVSYGRRFGWLAQSGFLVALVVIEAGLIRHRWRRLCGPVLFYDVVRTARQGRYALVRVVYAIVLFTLLNVMAQGWMPISMSADDLAQLADSFFAQLLMVQFTVIALLTPAYAAGAITEEKERKTLEYLLATDLSSREIILGKFLSRLGNLGLLLLTGFPVIALLQLLGGIDPNLLLMAFAVTLLLMMSLASLSVLCSVYVRKTRNAIITTYAGLVIYLIGLPFLADWLFRAGSWQRNSSAQPDAAIRATLDFINYGNPFYSFGNIIQAAGGQVSIIDELKGSLGLFAGIHIGVTLVALTWAALRLRPLALRTPARSRRGVRAGRKIRVVTGDPMVWKEMQPGSRSRRARLLVALMAFLSLVPAVIILGSWALNANVSLGQGMSDYVRTVGTMVACALLLAIMLRSSGSITIEKEKDTLDALLTTPLSRSQILFGKWLGNALAFRWTAFWWLGTIWLIGLATGGLHMLGLIALVIVLAVFAAACSSIGLAASAMTRSSMRAHVTALLMGLALLMCTLLPAPLVLMSGHQELIGQYIEFVACAMMPPVTIVGAALSSTDVAGGLHDGVQSPISFGIVGLLIWSALAVFFYQAAGNRFLGWRLQLTGSAKATTAGEKVAVGSAPSDG
jgi:ABC-type transport system involved in multi-copper enzyme maturation permease subunit